MVVLVVVGPGLEMVSVIVVEYSSRVPFTVLVITVVIVSTPVEVDCVTVWVLTGPVVVVNVVKVVVEVVKNPPPLSATALIAITPKESARTTSERIDRFKSRYFQASSY